MVQVTCTNGTFNVGWDNSNSYFADKGNIASFYCSIIHNTEYISDTVQDNSLRWYNGVIPTPVVIQTPEPSSPATPAETPTVQATESPTVVSTPEPMPSPEPSPSPSLTEPETNTVSITPSPQPSETVTPLVDTSTVLNPETATPVIPPSEETQSPQPVPVVPPAPPAVEPEPTPQPQPAPEPLPPAPEPEPEPPAPAPEPDPAPETVPEPPPVEPEPPAVEPDPEPIPEPAPEPPVIDVIEEVTPEPQSPQVLPEPMVTLDNGVVISEEVAIALELLNNPVELLAELFTDPGQVFTALSNIGADMSPEVREQSEKVVISAIIAGNIATQAAASAAGIAAYRRKP